MLNTTQCEKSFFGASGSSQISARVLVSEGTSLHSIGGETSSPSQVYFGGISPTCLNTGLASLMSSPPSLVSPQAVEAPSFSALFAATPAGRLRLVSLHP